MRLHPRRFARKVWRGCLFGAIVLMAAGACQPTKIYGDAVIIDPFLPHQPEPAPPGDVADATDRLARQLIDSGVLEEFLAADRASIPIVVRGIENDAGLPPVQIEQAASRLRARIIQAGDGRYLPYFARPGGSEHDDWGRTRFELETVVKDVDSGAEADGSIAVALTLRDRRAGEVVWRGDIEIRADAAAV